MNNKETRIALAGGGTGGHLYPLLAVASEIQALAQERRLNINLRYFGDGGLYKDLILGQGMKISKISGFKLRRYFSLANLLEVPKFFFAFFQALFKMFWFMPDVVFSKGGPGTLAAVLAARFYRIPVIIHESDAVPSLTAKISAPFAQRIGLSFASAAEHFKTNEKIAVVGNPIRPELLKNADDQKVAKLIFGFDSDRPLVLVLGGSQGSSRINEFMLDNFDGLVKNFQVLHQTGDANYENVKNEFEVVSKYASDREKNAYKIVPYLGINLKTALAAADLAISRAGAGAIFEIAAFSKPSVLIPYPEGAQGHQTANAYEYAGSGAAVVIEETNLLPHVFMNVVEKLVGDENKLKKMKQAAKDFSKPEAGKVIAEEVIRLAS